MQAIEFQGSVVDGMVRIPDEYRHLTENKKVRFVMMYHENDTELTARQETIARQVQAYYDGTADLVSQVEAQTLMQEFMQDLRQKHAHR